MATRTITGPFNDVAGAPIEVGFLSIAPQGQGVVTGGAFARRVWLVTDGDPTDDVDIVVPGNYRFQVTINDRVEWDFVAAIGDDVLTDLTIQQVFNSAYTVFDPDAMIVREGDGVDRLVAPTGASAGDLITVDADGETLVATPPGATVDANYRHTQSVAAAIWTVTHGLGKHCSTSIRDNAGNEMFPSRENITLNSFDLNFGSHVIAGTCDCN